MPFPGRNPVERVKLTALATANSAAEQACRTGWAWVGGRNRTLMRHRRSGLTFAIGLLATPMRLPTGITSLVAAASGEELFSPHALPASLAAIALPTITTRAQGKQRVASRVTAPARPKPYRAFS